MMATNSGAHLENDVDHFNVNGHAISNKSAERMKSQAILFLYPSVPVGPLWPPSDDFDQGPVCGGTLLTTREVLFKSGIFLASTR